MGETKYSLKDKVAIITGGGTGIGQSIALEFARAGANVAVCGRRLNLAEETAGQVKALGRHALAIQCDISKKADVDKMVQQVIDEFAAIDILVNNAGIRSDKCPIVESSEENYDRVLDIDLKVISSAARRWAGKWWREEREAAS